MQVIPVIDLMAGQVVRAKMGDRDAYRPIVTPLAATSDPADVVAGLLRLAPFPTLYVADLDAIRGHGDNFAAPARAASMPPGACATAPISPPWRAPAQRACWSQAHCTTDDLT